MTLTVYGQMRNVLNNKKRTFLGTPRLSIKLFHNTEGFGKRTSFPNGIRSRNSFPTRKTAGFKAFKPMEPVCLFFCLNKSKSWFRLRCRLCRHLQSLCLILKVKGLLPFFHFFIFCFLINCRHYSTGLLPHCRLLLLFVILFFSVTISHLQTKLKSDFIFIFF